MWTKEIKLAIHHQQTVTLLLTDGEVIQGIPESLTDRVKLRNDDGVIWIPVTDIKHINRLIQMRSSN